MNPRLGATKISLVFFGYEKCSNCCVLGALLRNELMSAFCLSHCNIYNILANLYIVKTSDWIVMSMDHLRKGASVFSFLYLSSSHLVVCLI